VIGRVENLIMTGTYLCHVWYIATDKVELFSQYREMRVIFMLK